MKFKGNPADLTFEIKLTKDEFFKLTLIQKYLGHLDNDIYDDDGELTIPKCAYVPLNEALSEAIDGEATLALSLILDKRHRYEIEEELIERVKNSKTYSYPSDLQ